MQSLALVLLIISFSFSLDQTILNYSSDARKTRLRLTGFVEDKTPIAAVTAHAAADPSSFKTRAQWTSEGKTLHLLAPIYHDLFHQSRLMVPLIPIFLDFTKVGHEFGIMSNKTTATTAYKFHVTQMKMFIRRVKTTASTKLEIERRLAMHPARYPLTQSTMKPFYLDANQKSATFENCFGSKGIPRYCTLMFCDQRNYRGEYSRNPFVFSHHDLVSLKISFGSDTYPSPEFRPVYTSVNEMDWSREYLALCNSTFKSDAANMITYDDFKSKYCIYCIDLGGFSTTSNDHISPKSDVTARLDISFLSTSQNPALVALLYTEHNCEIQVNSSRSVTRDYIL